MHLLLVSNWQQKFLLQKTSTVLITELKTNQKLKNKLQ